MKFPLPLFLAISAMNGAASAAVVNFDFNLRLSDDSNVAGDTYVGFGAAPDSAGNTHWNSVRRTSNSTVSSAAGVNNNTPGGGPIRDSSGAATTVDILLNGTTSPAGNTSMGQQKNPLQQELGTTGAYQNLMADYLQLNAPGTDSAGNVGTINGTINGLVANATYEIYFYGQGATYGSPGSTTSGANSLFGITSSFGGPVVGSMQQTGWDGVNGGNGVLTQGVEFVKFTTMANSLGEIFFIWQNVVAGVNVTTDFATDGSGGSSDLAALNGIQIAQVPEPSAALLACLGVLGMTVRRRR